MKRILVMCALALPTATANAAEPVAKVFKSDGKTLPYRLLTPASIEAGKTYPLVILLHGAGERGVDNKKQLVWFWNDKKPSVMTRPEVAAAQAFVLVPQCPEGKKFVEVPWEKGSYKSPEISEPLKLTLELTDSLLKELPIDADRVYVIGMSLTVPRLELPLDDSRGEWESQILHQAQPIDPRCFFLSRRTG